MSVSPSAQSAVSAQRRSSYRASVPEHWDELTLRLWRIPEGFVLRDRPLPSMLLNAAPRDLSARGMGVVCQPLRPQAPPLEREQRVKVVLQCGRDEVVLEGRIRNVRTNPDHSIRVGIEFTGCGNDLAGRRNLGRLNALLGQLQRAELRRRSIKSSRRPA